MDDVFERGEAQAWLEKILATEQITRDRVSARPGEFIRYLYDEWVLLGGYQRGKIRNSVRQLRQLIGENEIRSLEQKLRGKTRFTYYDAEKLLSCLFTNWNFDAKTEEYTPIPIEKPNIEEILSIIFEHESSTILLPLRTKRELNDQNASTEKYPNDKNIKISDDTNSIKFGESEDPSGWRINPSEKFPELADNLKSTIIDSIECVNQIDGILGNLEKAHLISILEQGIKEIESPLVEKSSLNDKANFLSKVRIAVMEKINQGYNLTEKIAKFLINIEKLVKLLSEFIGKAFS